MIVIFDTNIWLQNLFLRSPAGAAARFFILQKRVRVALPEVIRLEVEQHLRKEIRRCVTEVRTNHERLLAVFGMLKEVVLPDDAQIEQKISEGFGSLGVELDHVAFSFESAKDSFLRTITKTAPSDQSQQFKDGVLWADCIALLKQDDVVLVTNDKAFYEDRKYEKGLAVTLHQECASRPHRLTLLSELSDLLREIQTQVEVDHDALTTAFLETADLSTQRLLERAGFQIEERTHVDVDRFVTENPEILFVEFKIAFRCADATGQDRAEGSLLLRGDGLYNCLRRTFSNLAELGSDLRFRDKEGIEQERKNIVARVSGIVLGHREVSHSVRYKLD
jgi:PIN domain